MAKFNFILLFFISSGILNSQKIFVNDYDWNPETVWQDISIEMTKESYVYLKNYYLIEYIVPKDNDSYMYQTLHYIVYLSDDNAVDIYNKVYIPFNNATDIINIKARTYNKEGEVTNFDRKSIKEVENLDEYGRYKMFALDAVEKGSVVEVLYTVKKQSSLYGIDIIQLSVPCKDALFQIGAPKNLHFSVRVQNGTGIRTDSITSNKSFISYYFDYVPELKEEEYSDYGSSRIMVDYKFSYNDLINRSEKYTYESAAQDIYKYLYSEWGTAQKKLKKIIAELKINGKSEEEKIICVENYLKNNYSVKGFSNDEDYENIDFILKNKASGEMGILKFFVLLLKSAEIDHQACFSTYRERLNIDPDYMSWSYLDNYLIYFPGTGKYLSPIEPDFRYPLIPHQLMNNNALFINTIEVGGLFSALPEIRKIPVTESENSYHNLDATISFNENMQSVTVNHKQTLLGYSAMFIQPVYQKFSEEDKKDIINQLLTSVSEDVKVLSYKVSNYNPDSVPLTNPFTIEATITSSSVIEQAGDVIILKVGKMIGKQAELYSDEKRQLDIDIEFPHKLIRKINLNIPQGYKIKGNTGVESHIEGNNMLFDSKYKIEGSKMIIDITEEYNNLIYPKEEYENFRNVINAAAEFYENAVVILEKTNP